ncbi:MAG: metal-sensitive transcriptional regulator [Lysinibacillus sp.]
MKYDSNVTNRLKRIEGQLRGVLRMMEEEQDCKAIVTQLSAIRSAVDRTVGVIVTDNLLHCLEDAKEADDSIEEVVQEAMSLVIKSR